jgi:hypothetical protein
MALARGIRNNNPGNLDYSKANNWQGQLGIEVGVPNPRFARFDTPENGIRALAKTLRTYHNKHGLNTIKGIINRWAPPVENDTGSYAMAVARKIGVNETDPVDVNSDKILRPLVEAIIQHENGSMPYTPAVINEGVRRALA